jgi:hypothetical protein
LLRKNLADFDRRRRAIIERKLETALGECADYLTLALASAETADEERDALRRQVVGEKEVVDEVKPMWLVKGIIARRFGNRLAWMVEKNLSRLATQWADSVNAGGAAIEREAERRMDEFFATVTQFIASGADEAPQIRDDLARLGSARDEIRGAKSQEVAG